MKRLKGTVTRLSPYGFQCDNEDTWYNYDKNNKPNPPVKGWEIEFEGNEVNGKVYVQKIVKTGGKEDGDKAPKKQSSSSGGYTSGNTDRQSAFKSACEVASHRTDLIQSIEDLQKLAKWGDAFISGDAEEGFKGAEEVSMSDQDYD